MAIKVGLWIDRKKTVIVIVNEKGEEIKLIISKVEKQHRRSGDAPLKGPYEQRFVADDHREREFTVHLNRYLDSVIASIRDADAILILGPGETKGELKKRLERDKLGGRIVGMEAVDKMTDRQLIAKVNKYYQEHSVWKLESGG